MTNIYIPTTRTEVVNNVLTDMQNVLEQSDPFLERSVFRALGTGVGGRYFDAYLDIQTLMKQIFPDTATGDFLVRWGSYRDIYPLAASGATGPVFFPSSVDGIVIPVSESITSQNGNIYLTTETKTTTDINLAIISLNRNGNTVTGATEFEHFLATGQSILIEGADQTQYNGTYEVTATSATTFTYIINAAPVTPATGTIVASYFGAVVNVQSVAQGNSQNLLNGSTLNFSGSPLLGINPPILVTEADISGGSDVESTEAYRARVLYAYQNPHALFNYSQITSTVYSVAGVTRAWVFPITPYVGYVTVYFTRDNDAGSLLPDPTEVATVRDLLLAIQPSNEEVDQLIVAAPTPVNVDFNFTSIVPDTPEMRNSIIANLNFLFRDKAISVSQNVPALLYNSTIINTIDTTGRRLISFTLSTPTTDITVGTGELAILNNVTFA